jgi:hypothetical protein
MESNEDKTIVRVAYVRILKDPVMAIHLDRLMAVEIRMWHYLNEYVKFHCCSKVMFVIRYQDNRIKGTE